VTHHLICLTVDTDPDGLSGVQTNRAALRWDGLEYLQQHFDQFTSRQIPLTWFVRADGQLQTAYGSPLYLFDRYQQFWNQVSNLGHEIGWHPHLYRQLAQDKEPQLITNPVEACNELEQIWDSLRPLPYAFASFRNGEGWHTVETFQAIEEMGFVCDSTAIPGRDDSPAHPRNWRGTPNQPYFPRPNDPRISGTVRPLLEIPMNTWYFQTSYDPEPRLRYMNPCIHENLLNAALAGWETTLPTKTNLYVWTLIFHPEEIMPTGTSDALYSRSITGLIQNLLSMQEKIEHLGHTLEFVTMRAANARWRQEHIPS
jgi:hypothetical protein